VGVFQSVAETPSDASENGKLAHSHAGFESETRVRYDFDYFGVGRKDAVAAGKWWMAWAQSISQSMGVLRFGRSDGQMTLPSGKITGSPPDLPVEGSGCERSGRETLVSAAVAPGGGSTPALRPHPATLSAATSAPIAAIRAGRSSD